MIFNYYESDAIELCGDNWLAESLLTFALNLLGLRPCTGLVERWHHMLEISVGEPMTTLVLLPASAWARVVSTNFRHYRSLLDCRWKAAMQGRALFR
jgi:hypothetical protein